MNDKITEAKEPVFMFTSGSLRFAAWAGWHAAKGDGKTAQKWQFQAMREWSKEIGAGRQFWFIKRHNNDIEKYVSVDKLKELVDKFLRSIKQEIQKKKLADSSI